MLTSTLLYILWPQGVAQCKNNFQCNSIRMNLVVFCMYALQYHVEWILWWKKKQQQTKQKQNKTKQKTTTTKQTNKNPSCTLQNVLSICGWFFRYFYSIHLTEQAIQCSTLQMVLRKRLEYDLISQYRLNFVCWERMFWNYRGW